MFGKRLIRNSVKKSLVRCGSTNNMMDAEAWRYSFVRESNSAAVDTNDTRVPVYIKMYQSRVHTCTAPLGGPAIRESLHIDGKRRLP